MGITCFSVSDTLHLFFKFSSATISALYEVDLGELASLLLSVSPSGTSAAGRGRWVQREVS